VDFWDRVYFKHRYGSGGQGRVSGWINAFFPYINGRPNTTEMIRNNFDKTHEDDFPFGLNVVPVTVIDHGVTHNTEFYGGLVGVTMDPETYSVKAETGYAIQDLGVEE